MRALTKTIRSRTGRDGWQHLQHGARIGTGLSVAVGLMLIALVGA